MLTTILYIYLAGWAGSTVYFTNGCWYSPSVPRTECVSNSAQVSVIWPVAVPLNYLMSGIR